MLKQTIDRKQLLKDFKNKLSEEVTIIKQNPDNSYKPIHLLIIKTLIVNTDNTTQS